MVNQQWCCNLPAGAIYEGSAIKFRAAASGTTLVELSGATGGEPEISGNTVKLAVADFDSDSISVVSNAGGYQFELENDASGKTFLGSKDNDSISNFADSASINCAACNDEILSTDLVNRHTDATWTKSGSNLVYTSSSESSGFANATGAEISYVVKVDAMSFTLEGLSTETGVTIDSSKVILSATALENVNEVTLTNPEGYTFAMGEDVTQTSTNPEGWYLSETTATYKTEETFAGYELSGNQISYVATSGGETLVKVLNAQSLAGISLDDKTVTIGAQSFTFTAEDDENILTFTLDDS